MNRRSLTIIVLLIAVFGVCAVVGSGHGVRIPFSAQVCTPPGQTEKPVNGSCYAWEAKMQNGSCSYVRVDKKDGSGCGDPLFFNPMEGGYAISGKNGNGIEGPDAECLNIGAGECSGSAINNPQCRYTGESAKAYNCDPCTRDKTGNAGRCVFGMCIDNAAQFTVPTYGGNNVATEVPVWQATYESCPQSKAYCGNGTQDQGETMCNCEADFGTDGEYENGYGKWTDEQRMDCACEAAPANVRDRACTSDKVGGSIEGNEMLHCISECRLSECGDRNVDNDDDAPGGKKENPTYVNFAKKNPNAGKNIGDGGCYDWETFASTGKLEYDVTRNENQGDPYDNNGLPLLNYEKGIPEDAKAEKVTMDVPKTGFIASLFNNLLASHISKNPLVAFNNCAVPPTNGIPMGVQIKAPVAMIGRRVNAGPAVPVNNIASTRPSVTFDGAFCLMRISSVDEKVEEKYNQIGNLRRDTAGPLVSMCGQVCTQIAIDSANPPQGSNILGSPTHIYKEWCMSDCVCSSLDIQANFAKEDVENKKADIIQALKRERLIHQGIFEDPASNALERMNAQTAMAEIDRKIVDAEQQAMDDLRALKYYKDNVGAAGDLFQDCMTVGLKYIKNPYDASKPVPPGINPNVCPGHDEDCCRAVTIERLCALPKRGSSSAGNQANSQPTTGGGGGGGGGGQTPSGSNQQAGGTTGDNAIAQNTGGGTGGAPGGGTGGGATGGGTTGGNRSSVFACPANGCAMNNNGGTTFCRSQGLECESISQLPCARCVDGTSSASSLSRMSGSSSSRPSSSRSSARSSSRSSSSVSSRSSDPSFVVQCPADACDINDNAGNAFCGQQGLTCMDSLTVPCIRCDGDFGSSAYSDIDFGMSSSRTSAPAGTYVCGNGRTEPGEQCDDGNLSDKDACSMSCRRTSAASSVSSRSPLSLLFCGNGELDIGEQCDIGARNSDLPNALCRADCTRARCGDQIVDAWSGESCDDGNARMGDGCSPECTLEQAAGEPSEVLPGSLIELPFVPGSQSPGTVVPSLPAHGPVGNTGPETVAIMAAGASAGYTWMKLRGKRKS